MENKSLESLIQSVISDLESRGYSLETIKRHKKVFARLQRYCKNAKVVEYSECIGRQFVEYVKQCNPTISVKTLYDYTGSIRRLNCILSGKEWKKHDIKGNDYAKSCYDYLVNEYESYLMQVGKARKEVRRRMFIIANFLALVDHYGYSQINEITAEIILAGFEQASYKVGFRQAVGAFLQYAYNREMTKSNLKYLIPSVVRHYCVPSVYSPEEVEQLLASIDRTTAIGKRNYAIILIVARLGLRASDIANLEFSNLKTGKIEIVQTKTKKPLTTVLSDEIANAISDYTDNGRSQSPETHIFLNRGGYGVIKATNVYNITKRALLRTSINCGNRRKGSHSLRASLATALLSEGYDYPTVQKVLGQENIQ